MRVVIVPGNGCSDVSRSLWYGWLRDKLVEGGVEVCLENMPDPYIARESIWLPFMKDTMKCDEKTVIVGHSSGAEAAMRYAEKFRIAGMILVSACVTDLGCQNERESGYYSRPWDWDAITSNVKLFIRQYGSTDDPFIPWNEMEQVRDGLQRHKDYKLIKFDDQGHFQENRFPDVVKVIHEVVTRFEESN